MVWAIEQPIWRGGKLVGILGVVRHGVDFRVEGKAFREFAEVTPNVNGYFQNLLRNFSVEYSARFGHLSCPPMQLK